VNRCALVLALLIGSLFHAQAQSPLLRGRVVSDASNEPIRNARVGFVEDAGPPVLTDEEGRFAFAPIPPGTHSISAAKTGYATATSVASDGIEIRLLKSGAISGRVLDDAGEPMPLISVWAERVVRTAGRIGIEQVAAAETDDLGDYRLSGLPSGEFLVAISPGRVITNGGIVSPPAVTRPPQRFYPNAFVPQQAQPIAVRAGDDVVGIDLVLALPPMGLALPRAPSPPTPPAGRGTIRGRVARADGRPLRRAQVELSPEDNATPRSVTSTDDAGQYEFPGLRAGAYRVTARTLSFQTGRFGRHGDRGDAFSVAASALVDHVDISMPSRSAISGRIVDEYADPMANANVRVDRIEFSKGRRRLVSVMNVAPCQTNDLGRYRIFGLPPGRYVVSAVVGQAVPNGTTADWPGYARTYFPATPVATEAEDVEVSADQDRLNVDIALVRGHTARIAGYAFTEAGEPMQGVVWLSQSYRSGAVATSSVSARGQSDGAFEFKDLPPGEYVIQAATSWKDPATEGEFAVQFVTLNGTDATDVVLRMTTGSTIAGRLTFEGGDPPEPADLELSPVTIDQDWVSLADNPVGRAAIHDDWTFELGGVHGPRLLRLLRTPPGWALKSILVNGGESTDTVLPFGTKAQSLQNVEVILTPRVSGVSGVVTDASGRPFGDGVVIAFSTDRTQWSPESRFVSHVAASGGTFDLRPLAPGSYYFAAIDPPDTFDRNRTFEDPAFLESLVAGATRVTLTEGEARQVSLKAIEP
jgi:protocatechuate 3,4-dioxygenase beta subunit